MVYGFDIYLVNIKTQRIDFGDFGAFSEMLNFTFTFVSQMDKEIYMY